MVGRNTNKEIHHLFQVPVRGSPPSESKIISEIDEAYETSNIYLSVPANGETRKISQTSSSNLSSLDIQSNEGSQIERSSFSHIKKEKSKR